MNYREIRSKTVKTRCLHHCEWCDCLILKGSEANSRVVAQDDGLATYHSHDDCWRAMVLSLPAMQKDGYIEWDPGDFKRGEIYESK